MHRDNQGGAQFQDMNLLSPSSLQRVPAIIKNGGCPIEQFVPRSDRCVTGKHDSTAALDEYFIDRSTENCRLLKENKTPVSSLPFFMHIPLQNIFTLKEALPFQMMFFHSSMDASAIEANRLGSKKSMTYDSKRSDIGCGTF
jgi:hypothetical protein